MSTRVCCSECIKKQEEIYRLREKVNSLQDKLRYQERTSKEGFFGSSTPSSKKPFKPNSKEKKNGGAKKGHKGSGRSSITEREADVILEIDYEEKLCPECGVNLERNGNVERTVIDIKPPEIEKIVYKLKRCRCPQCKSIFIATTPDVLPKFLFGNRLLAYIATEHYMHGTTMGKLAKKTGINIGSLFYAMHHLGKIFEKVPERLINSFRQSQVKHADETSWRKDGLNGYGWLFCSPDTSIFRIRDTRSGKIAQEVFGTEPLPGVLVVDRYNGYNKSPCKIQYCYAHLLRNIQDLEKEFKNNSEIKKFVEITAPLLAEAMKLRNENITNDVFYKKAKKIKSTIMKEMNKEAKHPGIQKIQNIFREHKNRLFHWANDRTIPADNNFCERELRNLVIARKISFSSQSDQGAKTREILMTVLFTLKKRSPDNTIDIFLKCINEITRNPQADVYKILFQPNTTYT